MGRPPFPGARLGGAAVPTPPGWGCAAFPRLATAPASFTSLPPPTAQPSGQGPGPLWLRWKWLPHTAGPQLSGGSCRGGGKVRPDSCAVPSPQQGGAPVRRVCLLLPSPSVRTTASKRYSGPQPRLGYVGAEGSKLAFPAPASALALQLGPAHRPYCWPRAPGLCRVSARRPPI